mmetsp:Transcript_51422/g.95124  ORF Transcript_51422/g.95124 Transcript_51422/m.95124 type:complete len:175 (+) Transcript_51422:68-592(+)
MYRQERLPTPFCLSGSLGHSSRFARVYDLAVYSTHDQSTGLRNSMDTWRHLGTGSTQRLLHNSSHCPDSNLRQKSFKDMYKFLQEKRKNPEQKPRDPIILGFTGDGKMYCRTQSAPSTLAARRPGLSAQRYSRPPWLQTQAWDEAPEREDALAVGRESAREESRQRTPSRRTTF